MRRGRVIAVFSGFLVGVVLLHFFDAFSSYADTRGLLGVVINTDKAEYGLGEGIAIAVVLKAIGQAPVTVATYPVGTLRVASITHDGKKIKTPAPQRFSSNPPIEYVLSAPVHWKTLQAGESVIVTYPTWREGGGVKILNLLLNPHHQHQSRDYLIGASGIYTLRLRYSALIPPDGQPAALAGRRLTVISNEVTFRIK